MPTISAPAEAEEYNEDKTLLTLYALASEESGGFFTFRPGFISRIGKVIFAERTADAPARIYENVDVRELTPPEMARAEREHWIH